MCNYKFLSIIYQLWFVIRLSLKQLFNGAVVLTQFYFILPTLEISLKSEF